MMAAFFLSVYVWESNKLHDDETIYNHIIIDITSFDSLCAVLGS